MRRELMHPERHGQYPSGLLEGDGQGVAGGWQCGSGIQGVVRDGR